MVEQTRNEFQPDYVVLPGEVLSYELELRGMNQKELANRTGITPKHIVSLVKGNTSITPETAIKLERALGMPVDYWLNLEAQYQEIKARQDEEIRLHNHLDWLDHIPLKDMIKLGWIDRCTDKNDQLEEVLQFFGIASVKQWAEVWPKLNVAYRQHNTHEIFPEAVSAWLRQGEIDAANIQCAPYDKEAFRDALNHIRSLTELNPQEFVPAMQELCAKAGVAVVFVPSLPKTGLSGATRWLNSEKALIQLSVRYKANDHLWFTFYHEAGHILLHGKKELFLEGINDMDEEKEKEADQFAQHELIPRKKLRNFINQANYSRSAIRKFANKVGIAPGIVVGQLQFRKLLKYNQCNDLKCRYKWDHEK